MFHLPRLGTFLLIGLGTIVPLEAQPEAEQALQRGILAEESQGDPLQAEKFYREALKRSASAQVTSHTQFRLALVLQKLGKHEEALQLLRVTSRVPNEWGERARQRLGSEGTREPDDRLKARIDRAILQLQNGNDDAAKTASSELVWIGGAAAEALAEALRENPLDLGFVERGTRVLAEIGGEPLVDYVREVAASEDESLMRTMISSLGSFLHNQPRETTLPLGTEELRQATMPFLTHDSARLREVAYTQLIFLLDRDSIVRGLKDEDPSVRSALWERLQGRTHWWMNLSLAGRVSSVPLTELLELILPLAQTAIEQGNYDLVWLRPVLEFHGLRTRAEWEFYFRLVTVPGLPRKNYVSFQPEALLRGGRDRDDSWFSPKASRLVEVIDEIERADFEKERDEHARRTLNSIQQVLVGDWGAEDVPAVAQLLLRDIGWNAGTFEWIDRNAGPGDLTDLLPVLVSRYDAPALRGWFGAQNFGADAFGPTLASVRRGLADLRAVSKSNLEAVLQVLLRLEHPEVPETVEELARTLEGDALTLFVHALTQRGDERFVKTYESLLVRRAPVDQGQRNLLFGLCVRFGVTSPEPYLAAYAEGMNRSTYGGVEITGVQWMYLYDAKTGERCHTSLSEAEESRIAERCILEHGQAGLETLTLVPLRTTSGYLSGNATCIVRLPTWAKELLYRHSDRIPWREAASERGASPYERYVYAMIEQVDDARQEGVAEEVLVSFLSRCLEDSGELAKITLRRAIQTSRPQLVSDVIPLLQKEDLARDAFEWLTRYPEVPQAREAVLTCLTGEDPNLRALAIATFAAREPERAPALIRPLLDDPIDYVRRVAAEKLGHLLDKESVPQLVALLRDPSEKTREEARKALEAIQYYHEQKARWERWLRDENLGATSAADALIQQAKTGKTEEIRLAAIRSLGVLGVPETLPVLIEWMGSEDAKIAAAAREAVTAIHESRKK